MPDETFALMRRELERAEAAPPLVHARILERIPTLFPDVSDLSPEPRCGPDLADRLDDALSSEQPTEFSRLALARIRAIGHVGDTTDVMRDKGSVLARFSALPDDAISEYRFTPGELGPAPPKTLFRRTALGGLASGGLFLNIPETRATLLGRLRSPREDAELLLLESIARLYFDDSLWGHPTRPSDASAPNLLRTFVADVRRRLDTPPARLEAPTLGERVSLEIALGRLADLGTYGARFGVSAEARPLVDRIVEARGALPATRGIDGGARDLAVAAVLARYDLEHSSRHVGADPTKVRPRRRPVEARQLLEGAEPPARAPDEAVAARLRDLEGELAALRYARPRCHVVRELAAWTREADGPRRFGELVAPLARAGKLQLGTEPMCRLDAALDVLGGADESARIELLLRVLRARPDDIAPYDDSTDEHHPALARSTDKLQLAIVAARALGKHLAWIDRSPELRAWLADRARDEVVFSKNGTADELGALLQPALDRLLERLADGDEGERAQARAIAEAWLRTVRATWPRDDITNVYPAEVTIARLLTLATLSRRLGVETEVRALLAEIGDPAARPERARWRRAAAIAAFLIES